MTKTISISACFPVFNEGETVYAVVMDAHRIVSSITSDFELLVCNDGSTDNTAQELERLSVELPNVRILDNLENRGIAFTFARLYREARKDYVFLNATDGQWPNEVLVDLVKLADSHDIVVSVRADNQYGLIRKMISFFYNAFPMVLFGVKTVDAGGVKLIARGYLYVDSIISRSPFADAERLIRARRAGARIGFVPIVVNPRRFGNSKAIKPRVLWHCVVDVGRLFAEINLKWKADRQGFSARSPE